MKALTVSGLALICAVASSAAYAFPADDPFRGVELGMSQQALSTLAESSGARLDCRERRVIVNRSASQVQYCTADIAGEGQQQGRIAAILAPTAGGAARIVVFAVQGTAADAPAVRERLVQKWGKPALSQADAAGFLEKAQWRLGGRMLVHADGCRRGQSSCIEYSESSWARQAARSIGMEFAPT